MKIPKKVDRELFRIWLQSKFLRPASLEDIWGTHHNRPIYEHPNTKQPFVALPGTPPLPRPH